MMSSEGVAVVTGASGAIGGAVARALAASGYDIVVHSHRRSEVGAALADELVAAGGRAVHANADLTDLSAARAVAAAARDAFGRIDVLVAAAGATVGGGPFEELSTDDWRAAFDQNFLTAVNATTACLPLLREGGRGRVVLTSSIRGIQAYGREGIMSYSAAKAAIVNLTSTLAKDVGPEVLVNAVAPGFVYTPNYDAMSQELQDSFTDNTVIKRFITPDEIAQTYVHLATSDVITGQTLVIDGGFSLKIA